jgi:acetyltransferase-like isoleucine patch superfamily enzyme
MSMDARAETTSSPQTPAATVAPQRIGWYRYLATSQNPLPRFARRVRNGVRSFGIPAPKFIFKPILVVFLVVRGWYYFFLRVFICEPLFKAYCTKYGRNLRTGCFIHWIMGKGDIVIGDNVILDGKISIMFGARFSDRPILEIGDKTGIGHDCMFVVGKRITIGRDCMIAAGTMIRDSNGHPVDPASRAAGQAPDQSDVRPVTIGDGVWIGHRCLIFPGVRIGTGSIVSAGSVVHMHVPPYSVVAGNPARVMFRLKRPDSPAQAS